MRDVIKIFAAGSILTDYALLTPTMVEALQAPAPVQKAFTQRLSEVEGPAPVSAVIGSFEGRMAVSRHSPLPRFARLGEIR